MLAQNHYSASGLSAPEAAQRLATHGPNELKQGHRISPLQILLGQFKSLIIWILIAAGVVSGLLGETIDAIAIFTIVVFNAVIGFYQEFNAEKSIAALQKMTAPQAKVRRDGQITSIPAAGIVVGDILELESGDLVAADARLLVAASLTCIESALTGESEAVTKQAATIEPGESRGRSRKHSVHGHQRRDGHGPGRRRGHGDADPVGPHRGTDSGSGGGGTKPAGSWKETGSSGGSGREGSPEEFNLVRAAL